MQEHLFTCTTLTFSSTSKTMDPSDYEITLSYLMTDSYPDGCTKDQKRNLRKRASKYLAINDKLVKLSEGKQLLVIKTDDIPSILREIHYNVGHQCARYSYNIAKERYFRPVNSFLREQLYSLSKESAYTESYQYTTTTSPSYY